MAVFVTVQDWAYSRSGAPQAQNGRMPWVLELRSSTWFITVAVAAAVFVDIFLYAVIVPVFPYSLVERNGIEEKDVPRWVSILFSMEAVGLLVAAPIFGYLSDLIDNRKRPMLGGMLVLAAATIMLCFAKETSVLIIGRILQGASAGVVWVVGLALLAETVGPNEIGQFMGYATLANSLAALLAPLLGGIVYEKAGYYAVFGMSCGLIVVDLVFRLLLVEKKEAQKWTLPDLTPETTRSNEAPQPSVTNDHWRANTKEASTTTEETASIESTNSSTPDSATGILAKGAYGDKAPKRVPPFLILLKSRRMQAAFLANIVDAMILTAFDVTLPLFVEETFRWKALGGGLSFLALLSPAFLSPLYGKLIDKRGPRLTAVLGLLLCVPPWACLKFVTRESMSQKVLLCILLFFIGLGAHLTLAATMTEFTCIAADKERKQPGSMGNGGAYAQSYSLFNMSWAAGSLIGSYFAGAIHEHAGMGTMGWSYAILCAVVSIPTLLYCGGWIGNKKQQKFELKLVMEKASTPVSGASFANRSGSCVSV